MASMKSVIDEQTSKAVAEYRRKSKVTAEYLASCLGLKRSTFNDRVRGVTAWRLRDADKLARMGVDVPALGSSDGVKC